MDIKIEAKASSHHLKQVPSLEETQKRNCYRYIEVKSEIEVKEPFEVKEEEIEVKEEPFEGDEEEIEVKGEPFEGDEEEIEVKGEPFEVDEEEIEVKEEPFEVDEEEIEVKEEDLYFEDEDIVNDELFDKISDLERNQILSVGNALPQAKTIDLLQTMEKNLTQNSKISSDSEYSSDEEVCISKRKVDEYENKIFHQKKKIKRLQNEYEVLKSKYASLKNDNDTLKEKLNRDRSNAGIVESSCTEMLKVLLQKITEIEQKTTKIEQKTTKIEASLKTTLEEPSSRNKNKEKKIIFGSISFPEKPFLTISRRPKNSLFVKDLVSLLWSEEDLSQRSLTGKKHYNSKEIKQPLTPEKRFAIEEALKDRLKKQQYHDATIALELKQVNRYIAEKINDVRKCNLRRNLNMNYDIQN